MDTMTNKDALFSIATILILFCALIGVLLVRDDENIKHKTELFLLELKHEKTLKIKDEQILIQSTALKHVYMYNINAYPVTMQKLIKAAKDNNAEDFRFYQRQLKEQTDSTTSK